MIRDVQRQMGSSVVFVTHDMSVHANIADRVGIIYAGPARGRGADAHALRRTTASLHRPSGRRLPRIGDTTPKAGARRTTAQPRRTAHRLPLPPALPAGHRQVQDRGAAARAGRARITARACWRSADVPSARPRSRPQEPEVAPDDRAARGLPRLQALRHGRPALARLCRCRRRCQSLAVVRRLRDLHDHRRVRIGKDDAGAHDPRARTADERRHPVRGQEQRRTSNPRCPARLHAARAAGVPEPVRDLQSAQAGRSLPLCIGASPLWRRDQGRGGGGDGRCAAQGRPEPQRGRPALCRTNSPAASFSASPSPGR